ncbi:MAG: cytochrome c maturation protein CcmE [Candidatus Paracaedibacteraceae bacterium]|nr:cytochrome c maturation protein CcmE [Candidatus Paracaedibacteraceae bacterium]
MTKQQKNRLVWLSLVALAILGGSIFIFSALNQSMMYFVNPTELLEKPYGISLRLGGMVEKGSILRKNQDMKINFNVTDFTTTIPVVYHGITPDLFQEGQGVVADGTWDGTVFVATKILAKHDENYMPPTITK